MEWISSYIFGGREEPSSGEIKKAPEHQQQQEQVFYHGLGPDDSLNGPSDDDSDGTISLLCESADSFLMELEGSQAEEEPVSDNYKKEWTYSNYTPMFDHTRVDFARVGSQGYGNPLLARVYWKNGAFKLQIGVYDNVPISKIEECLRHQQLCVKNLLLILEDVESELLDKYEDALETVLPSLFCQREVVRMVIWMDKWQFASELGPILSRHCKRLTELNIGAPRLPMIPLPHPPMPFEVEAHEVIRLLHKWLPTTADTLRCLRIYTFIRVDDYFAELLNSCEQLQHVTLSKMEDLISTVEFTNIRTFELDKQGFSSTKDDVAICRRLTFHFPKARTFSLVGCNYGPLVEMVLKRLSERQKQTYEVFQPIMKLDLVAAAIQVKFKVERTNPAESTNPKSMLLWNERFDSRVLVHRGDQNFVSSSRSSYDDFF